MPRPTARVVPVDDRGRVLLLRGEPQGGREHWFAIGGAVEPGETAAEAAVREAFEETAISLSVDDLGDPFYEGPHCFVYNGRRYENDASFYAVTLDSAVRLDFSGVEPGEVIDEAEWRYPDEFPIDDASEPDLGGLLRAAVKAIASA